MTELLSRIRRTPERLLHRFRRRKAVAALRTRARPATLLVMCHGNICRSPVAAALLQRALAPGEIAVTSAGFIGPNRPSPVEAVEAARRHGVDLSRHSSRLITAAAAHTADLIVVMDPSQQRLVCERFGRSRDDVLVLGDFDPAARATRGIRDPVTESRAVFEAVYDRIARCVGEIVTILRSNER